MATTLHASDRTARLAVLTIWSVLLAVGIGFWWHYARDVPHGDVWTALVPVATGKQPIDLEWLFSYHNVHVVIVPRILFVTLGFVTEFDFRALGLLGIIGMAASALALISTVRMLRGELRLSDATFAFVLLGLGHGTNFLGPFRVQYVAAVVASSFLLVAIMRTRKGTTNRRVLGALASLLVLAGCGLNGVVFLPFFAIWPALIWKLEGRRRAVVAGGVVFAVFALALVVAYWLGMPRHLLPPASEGALDSMLRRVLMFLGVAFGATGPSSSPFVGLAVVGFCVVNLYPLLRAWRHADDRACTLGLLLFLGGMFSLAGAVGWGRTHYLPNVPRYTTLLAPLMCWSYLSWTLERRPDVAQRAQRLICVLAIALCVVGSFRGIAQAQTLTHEMDVFDKAARGGFPPRLLASLYAPKRARFRLPGWIAGMRDARIGPYRGLGEQPSRHRMEPLFPTAGNAPRAIKLEPGQQLTQQFRAREGAEIQALYVLFLGRSGPRTARVRFRISEVNTDETKIELAQGELGISAQSHYRLEFVPFTPADGALLELKLWLTSGDGKRVRLRIPYRKVSGAQTALALETTGTSILVDTGEMSSLPFNYPAAMDVFVEYAHETFAD